MNSSVHPAQVRNVKIDSPFWNRVVNLVRDSVLPYEWAALNDQVEGAEPSHCLANLRIAAGEAQGEYQGMVFQDSDLAKWLEAAAYSLSVHPDPELERIVDETIDLLGRAQQPDGYLNSYFTVKEPGKRWTNLQECHELYCAGHLMEAAVAYYQATGKRKLLDIMTRMARHIDSVMGPEPDKLHGIPGHEEIELALVKMYEATGERFMLDLASYFIDERGKQPSFFKQEYEKRKGDTYFGLNTRPESYAQNHLPVREQTALEGHSVRALYLATGMAEVAREKEDESLLVACKRLFDNLLQRRMYVTGGVGSTENGEAFTFDYDLPNDTAYAETCASIALCFFARSMLRLDLDGRYADAMERALYNTCLAGMSLDGKNFFYVNPLEVLPEASHKDPNKRHVLPVRPKWFGCACCPPNLARLIASLGSYAYSWAKGEAYVHLYLGGEARLGDGVALTVNTEYPRTGRIEITPSAGKYALNLRVPGFSQGNFELRLNGKSTAAPLNKGYLRLDRAWQAGDRVELLLDMTPRRVYANPSVRADAGKVCLMRGPLVYCLEQVDNGANLSALYLPTDSPVTETFRADKLQGITELKAMGKRAEQNGDEALYRYSAPRKTAVELTFIPYYAWANRGENEMCVWIKEG